METTYIKIYTGHVVTEDEKWAFRKALGASYVGETRDGDWLLAGTDITVEQDNRPDGHTRLIVDDA